MARSLGAGSSSSTGQFQTGSACAATLLPFRNDRAARAWRPAAEGPLLVLFSGHLDNLPEVARKLGVVPPAAPNPTDLARVYARALLRWGDSTDLRLIGEYATIALNSDAHTLRLARSPLRAPPLHYHASAERVIASTVPRPIFAAGVEQRLDDRKLADIAWFNTSDEARSCFVGVNRVPLGSEVVLTPQGATTRRYYDIRHAPAVPKASRSDLVEQARTLLEAGTRAALAGSKRPAIMLSGGLDSSLVALATLDVLPPDQSLAAYTRVPETAAPLPTYAGRFCDERGFVEQFCAMNPRIVPHFDDAAGLAYDEMATDLFHATGTMAHGLGNLTAYHRLWSAAREAGCDRVLLAEFGNMTVSADGSWGFAEYLCRLRWRQLYRALRHADDDRSMLRRFVALALMPLMPDGLWRWQRRFRGKDGIYSAASPLRRDYALAAGVVERSEAAGFPNPRYPERNRNADARLLQDSAWGDFSYIYHGFEQIHGMEQRDPTAYRPFFEFCAGLPTDMFLYDGTPRWLAREMLKGKMPEDQRTTRKTGRHNADWQHKLGQQRTRMIAELQQLAKVPRIAQMLDVEQALDMVETWPEGPELTDEERLPREGALQRVLLMSRFINYVEGRNLG